MALLPGCINMLYPLMEKGEGEGEAGAQASEAPKPAKLDDHMALFRKKVGDVKSSSYLKFIKRDFSMGEGEIEGNYRFQQVDSFSPSTNSRSIFNVHYAGVEGSKICFATVERNVPLGVKVEAVAKKLESKVTDGSVVILSVNKLSDLNNLPPWPAYPTASPVDEVKVMSDESEPVDGPEKYKRTVILKFCSLKPSMNEDTNFIMIQQHRQPSAADQKYDPEVAKLLEKSDKEKAEMREEIRLQHDTFWVWALSNDKTVDLSK